MGYRHFTSSGILLFFIAFSLPLQALIECLTIVFMDFVTSVFKDFPVSYIKINSSWCFLSRTTILKRHYGEFVKRITRCTSHLDRSDFGRPFLFMSRLPRIFQYRCFLHQPSVPTWSIFILCLMYKWNGLHLFYSTWRAESHPVLLCEFWTSVMDINEGSVLHGLSFMSEILPLLNISKQVYGILS